MSSLEVVGVSVRFGDLVAVDDVTLTLEGAAVLALLGPSGCGKSTLLRAITGLETLAGGRISFDGTDLAAVPVHRRGFGLMFQDGVLFPHRTVAGNIGYGLPRDQDRSARSARIRDLLELVGLPGFEDRPVGTLSGGQAQRVALARALAPRPRLLLLDEPLAALDAALRVQLAADLRRILHDAQTPAVFVTHDHHEAYGVADQVALMRAGRIVQLGPPPQVWSHPVDAWAARFLGFDTVLDPAASATARTLFGYPGSGRLALRPGALQVDPTGTIGGVVAAVTAGPDRSVVQVQLPQFGVVSAESAGRRLLAPGQQVRLTFDPDAAADLADIGDHAGP